MSNLTKLFGLSSFIALILFVSACGNGPESTGSPKGKVSISSSIPASSSAVFMINTSQLLSKADYESLKQTSFFKDWLSEVEKDSPEALPFLKDPAKTGVHLNGDMAFAANFPADFISKQEPDFAIIMPIADKAKLQAALDKATNEKEEKPTTEEREGYSITKLDNDQFWVMNDNIFAFVNKDDDAKIKAILNPEGEGIKSNAGFKTQFDKGNDMFFWMSADEIVENMLQSPQGKNIKSGLSMAQIDPKGLEGNSMFVNYNFEDGQVVSNSGFKFSEILQNELGDIFPEKISVDYSKHIPTENLVAAFTFGLNTDGIMAFMAKRGFDRLANMQVQARTGLSLEDLHNTISGDMASAVYASEDGEDAEMIVIMGLKDKTKLEETMQNYTKMGVFEQKDNLWVMKGQQPMDPTEEPMEFRFKVVDNLLFVCNSAALLEKAEAGASNNTMAEIQEGWMGMYIDYEKLAENQETIANNLPMDPMSMAMLGNMAESNELQVMKLVFDGGMMSSTLSLKSKDINSLKKIIELTDKMHQKSKEMEKDDEFEDFDEFEDKEEEMNT